MENKTPSITRNKFLKLTAAATSLAAIESLTGCASLPELKQLKTDPGKNMILTNGTIIDVVNGKSLKNMNVLVKNGIIESISVKLDLDDKNVEIIDLNGCYLIPGLIDAHCHATTSGASSFDPFGGFVLLNQNKKNFSQHIVSGTTTIRDMGAFYNMFHDYLDMLDDGSLVGPRVVFCNQIINIKGAHPSFDLNDATIFGGMMTSYLGDGAARFTSTDGLKKALIDNLDSFGHKRKPSFIKLTATENSVICGKDKLPVLSEEQLDVAKQFAADHNIPISVHIHTKFGLDAAIRVGANSIEHIIMDNLLTKKDVQTMRDKKIAIVPTMCLGTYYAAEEAFNPMPEKYKTDFVMNELAIRKEFFAGNQDRYCHPDIQALNRKTLQLYSKYECGKMFGKGIMLAKPEVYFEYLTVGVKNLQLMRESGVLIGCGTDAGVPFVFHGTIWREMEFLKRAGFSNTEIIKCATINNAKILKMEDKIGSIEAGKYADFAILEENPLEKIEAYREPLMVIKGGQVLHVKDEVKVDGNRTTLSRKALFKYF